MSEEVYMKLVGHFPKPAEGEDVKEFFRYLQLYGEILASLSTGPLTAGQLEKRLVSDSFSLLDLATALDVLREDKGWIERSRRVLNSYELTGRGKVVVSSGSQ